MFINRESVRQAGDTTLQFLDNKITRLYSLYDTGLNTINRNYSGLIQDMNSDELAINHNSLTTVFSLSSNFGVFHVGQLKGVWLSKLTQNYVIITPTSKIIQ